MNRFLRLVLRAAVAAALFPAALRAALEPASASGEEAFRLNCGAAENRVLGGNYWMKDEAFESLYRWGHFGGTPAEDLSVVTPELPEVYRSHRYGRRVNYRLEVPPGGYSIRILFCETYWDGPGQRLFRLRLNGTNYQYADPKTGQIKDTLDIWSLAGGKNKPYAVNFNLPIYQDGINVEVYQEDGDPDNAMISGIEAQATAFFERDFLRWMTKKFFWYFWNEADPATGLVSDTANSWAPGRSPKAHIAATGFGLSLYTVAASRGWITVQEAYERTKKVLDVFENQTPNVHGFWYRFLKGADAQRWVDGADKSEISTVDSSLFILGALQAGEYFRGAGHPDIADQADRLYRRMDWTQFINQAGGDNRRNTFLSMGWSDESGYLSALWDSYSESMFVYPLAFGSPTHAISTAAWTNLNRLWGERQGIEYMNGPHPTPLFLHQFQHLYYNFRGVYNDFVDQGLHDDFGDYSKNSLLATEVNRLTCVNDGRYAEQRWGLTPAYSGKDGLYHVYGLDDHDGTVAPAAAGSSIGLTHYHSANYTQTLAALRHMYFQYKHHVWGRNGFTDSFNVGAGEIAPVTLGINNGPMAIALANQLTEDRSAVRVMESLMNNAHVQRGLAATGLRPYTAPYAFASSVMSDNHARFAFDGSPATRWESVWEDPQFIGMDFISPTTVNKATLRWETAHAKDYRVQYSNDNAHWTDAAAVTNGDGGEDVLVFPAVTARYFRVKGERRGGVGDTVWGYSLWEVSFENDPALRPAAPTLLGATRATGNSLGWSWTDNSANEDGFRFYGAPAPEGPYTLLATLPAGTTTHTELGLSADAIYYRRVTAFRGDAESDADDAEGRTIPLDTVFGPTAADGTLRGAFDEHGVLHVTYFDPSQRGLRYVTWNGTSWSSPEWIDENATGYPAADGSNMFLVTQDLALDAQGRAQVVYYTEAEGLRWAVRENGVWSKETVAATDYSVVANLAVDPSGIPRVVWSAPVGGAELRHARRTAGGWESEAVAGGVAANTSHLALDEAGRLHVAYGTNDYPHALYYTVRDGAGWSAPEPVDSLEEWRYRVEPTILIDGDGRPRVMDCLNNRDGRVRYNVRTDAGWVGEYAHRDEPDWEHTGTPAPGFALDGAGPPRALYALHFNYNPHWFRTVFGGRGDSGWTETVLAEDARWSAPAALALDAQGRALLLTLSTDGRLRLIRWDTGAPAPVGGGRAGRAQAPRALTGVARGDSVTWTWTDGATNETGYRVYGATTATGPFALMADLGPDATSHTETGVSPRVPLYRYVAVRNAGGSATSALVKSGSTRPSKPMNVAVSSRSADSLTWTWTDTADNETGYRLRRAGDGVLLSDDLPAGTTAWTQSGLSPNTAQSVVIEAFNEAGATASTASRRFFTLARPPIGSTLTWVDGVWTFAWDANGNPAHTIYRVFRSLGGAPFTPVHRGLTLTAALPTAPANREVVFKVAAQNGEGVASAFDVDIATRTPAAPATAAINVSPNPYRPAQGELTLDGLGPNTRVRLFSSAGRLVTELTADGGGRARWDGRAGDGRAVAAGVSFGLADGETARRVFRVAVVK
ncbi:MAG: hypothetical protein E6Q99_04740 [Elusimicrobia bacterium]|nr:MAG: hypothetical protein E6Q99_04740 [Elusimicrobiota bacterium]